MLDFLKKQKEIPLKSAVQSPSVTSKSTRWDPEPLQSTSSPVPAPHPPPSSHPPIPSSPNQSPQTQGPPFQVPPPALVTSALSGFSGVQHTVTSTIQNPVTLGIQNPLFSNSQNPVTSGIQNPLFSNSQNPGTSGIQNPLFSNSQNPGTLGIQNPLFSNSQNPVTSNILNPSTSNTTLNRVTSDSPDPLTLSILNPLTSNLTNPVTSHAQSTLSSRQNPQWSSDIQNTASSVQMLSGLQAPVGGQYRNPNMVNLPAPHFASVRHGTELQVSNKGALNKAPFVAQRSNSADFDSSYTEGDGTSSRQSDTGLLRKVSFVAQSSYSSDFDSPPCDGDIFDPPPCAKGEGTFASQSNAGLLRRKVPFVAQSSNSGDFDSPPCDGHIFDPPPWAKEGGNEPVKDISDVALMPPPMTIPKRKASPIQLLQVNKKSPLSGVKPSIQKRREKRMAKQKLKHMAHSVGPVKTTIDSNAELTVKQREQKKMLLTVKKGRTEHHKQPKPVKRECRI